MSKDNKLEYKESQVPIPMDEINADEYAQRNDSGEPGKKEWLRQGYLGACKPKNDEIHAFGVYITKEKIKVTEANAEEIHEKFQLQYTKD